MADFAFGFGDTGTDVGYSLTVDSSGNTYVTGYFSGTVDFDLGSGTANLTSAGSTDTFIAKYDSNGDYQWAGGIGGTSTDSGYSISLDGSNNVYVTGYFQGTADFDIGSGTANLTSSGVQEVFIAKYDTSGNYQWAGGIGGTGNDLGQSIAIDSSGNSYVTGYFNGTADFDPSGSTANLTSAGGLDTFAAKYDSSGNYVWAGAISGTGTVDGKAIAVDNSGNSYVTGYFSGTVDFDPSGSIANLASVGSDDAFIAKYDSSGNYIWAGAIGGVNLDRGHWITVDSSGNSYVTGRFVGTTDFDPSGSTANLTSAGNDDVFIAKYDSSGNYQWAGAIGGTGNDIGYGISIDSSSNVYVSGSFIGTADFDPSGSTANLTSSGADDAFVAKYDSSGNYVWASAFGGTNSDYSQGVAVDNSGETYVTGYFNGTADFDPSAGTTNLTSAGSDEAFLVKLSSSGALGAAIAVASAGSGGSSDSGGVFTKSAQSSADYAGTETNHTLTNNTSSSATGAVIENSGNSNVVNLTLSSGASVTNVGSYSAETSSEALTMLTAAIETTVGSSDQSAAEVHGTAFMNGVGSGIMLDVRTLTFTNTGTTAESVALDGNTSATEGSEAIVIDMSYLPTGSELELSDIEFAVIVGAATVTGGGGKNYVVGDASAQNIHLGALDDTLAGGHGDDTIGSEFGEDIVYGNQGNDYVFGRGGMDTLYGGQDQDIIDGGNDNDVIYGNMGWDTILGGGGEDVVDGGDHADVIYGNTSSDTLSGGDGNDTIYGGQGSDTLAGGMGNDLLDGNKGDDVLIGGDGSDNFQFLSNTGDDQINDFVVGTDSIIMGDGLTYTVASSGNNTLLTLSDGGTVTLIGVTYDSFAATTTSLNLDGA